MKQVVFCAAKALTNLGYFSLSTDEELNPVFCKTKVVQEALTQERNTPTYPFGGFFILADNCQQSSTRLRFSEQEGVLNSNSRFVSVEGSRTPYVEFREVSKSFESHIVLDRIGLQIMPGTTVCVLGRSGVGKSVCLRIIMGFLKPDAGRVIVAGQDITDYSEDELQSIRKKITMVFQEGALFDSLTVAENVAFPLRERRLEKEDQIQHIVDGLLERLGVRSYRDMLPSQIPTGLKRSVAIARALAAQPEANLYDEPTTMVDPLMARRLAGMIQKLKLDLKLTGVVVTHDMRLVERVADHVFFLDRAKVVFSGTPKEMERSPEPVVQRFLQLDRIDSRSLLPLAERERQLVG